MSSLEPNQNERGVLSPPKNISEFFDAPDMPISPTLFSADSHISPKGNLPDSGVNPETPLTPASNSIEGISSDTSEAASGDTVPSSITEDNLNTSAQTLSMGQKQKDSELDRCTVTEAPAKPPLDMRTSSRMNDADPDLVSIDKNLPVFASLSNSKSDLRLKNPEPQMSTSKVSASKAAQPRDSRRHSYHDTTLTLRSSADMSQNRQSLDHSHRPKATQLHSLRKISTILRPCSKDKLLSPEDKHNPGRNPSEPGSELTRMKSTMESKNVQRKKDALEDVTHMVGNKITEGHQNFVMAYNMLTGIRVAVSRCSGVMRKLSDADFKATKKLSFDMDGSELTPSSKYDFKFKDYSPAVFRELRSLFGIDPADYLMSITGKYILSELGSSGKSGSFFYYSRDYRFIIKTIHHSEHKQLRRMLQEYYVHVKNNPNTMVSQFYGLHRLKVKGGIKRVHFLVMNNLFPPHRDIHVKYDLKGSTWGRHTNVPDDPNADISSHTLKDLNWLQRKDHIKFGPEKKKIFLAQLEADVKLLKKINVMDYSLLLGIHDVKKGNSANVAKLTVFDPKSNLKAEVFKTNPRDIDRQNDLPSDVFPGRSKYIFYGHDGGIRATNERNEPVSEIYYLGIIDCLTNYSIKKKLETAWRSITQSRNTISAVPAREYGDRFLKFIKDGISDIKVKID